MYSQYNELEFSLLLGIYKNLFLTRKQTDHVRHLIWPEWKIDKKSLTIRHQKASLSKTTYLQYELEDQTVKTGKIASRKVLSLTSWITDKYSNMQEAFCEMKLKSNESRRPKFYELNPTERKFNPKTLLKKQPFRRLKIEWKMKHFDKTKKKKYFKFKELCFPDTLSDKFQQITL